MQVHQAYASVFYVTSFGCIQATAPQPMPSIVQREEEYTRPAELTEYQKWKISKSNQPFPIINLTNKDIDLLLRSRDSKALLLRYCLLLNNGRLPHGETSPQKARLIKSRQDGRIIDQLNSFLIASNITPLHLFNPTNLTLRQLYLMYKDITKPGASQDLFLEENISPNQLERIAVYLEAAKATGIKDDDFHALAQMEGDFERTVLSDEFVNRLLELATRPEEKITLEPIPQIDDGNTVLPDVKLHLAERAYGRLQVEKERQNGLRITDLRIPLFEALGIDYRSTEKFPNQDHVVKVYKKSGKQNKIERHHDFHAYNTDKNIRVILTLSNGRTIEVIIKLAECKILFQDLKEQKYSAFIPELAQKALQHSA